jgi:pro-sigmaK processing inhibitor BofA
MSAFLGFLILLFLFIFAVIFWSVLKQAIKLVWGVIINTVLGLLGIFFLNLLGFSIPINIVTVLVAAIFGLLGVAVLALLALFGGV